MKYILYVFLLVKINFLIVISPPDAISVGSRIYVCGGYQEYDNWIQTCESYDVSGSSSTCPKGNAQGRWEMMLSEITFPMDSTQLSVMLI